MRGAGVLVPAAVAGLRTAAVPRAAGDGAEGDDVSEKDLRAAAEAILRGAEEMPRTYPVRLFELTNEAARLAVPLARARLAAHDPLPVTTEWLRAVGFTPTYPDLLVARTPTTELHFDPEEPPGETWAYRDAEGDYAYLPDQPTRGDVRRLCGVLRIPLKGGAT